MQGKKNVWTGLYEDERGMRSCREFWVTRDTSSSWAEIAQMMPEGNSLIAIFPGKIPVGMRWLPVAPRERSEQQLVDVWTAPNDTI